ncbi:hypothetical protein [Tranquillimonas rosea]|uniref:hypothetical protein n=1 Tax=Tranquillimonas rosea TaxID=641238 RepID=UPI003BA98826
MKRIFYFPTGRRMWFDLARSLEEQGVATPVAWLGDPRHDATARETFPDCEVVPVMPSRAGSLSGAPLWRGTHAGFWTSAEHDRARDHAIKLMDRVDWTGEQRGVTRAALFDGLVLWALALVERHDPDALVMSEPPHQPLQLVIEHVMRWLGRDVLCFAGWSIMPLMMLRRDYDGPILPAPDGALPEHLRDRIGQEADAFVGRFDDAAAIEPRYMAQQRDRAARIARRDRRMRALTAPLRLALRPLGRVLGRRYAIDIDPPHASDNLFTEDRLPRAALGDRKRTIAARRTRLADRLDAAIGTDLPADYVYVPLHYEPERTTNPDGGVFHDQIRALSVLRALLPDDIGIVVKEHPSQLSAAMRGFLGRSPGFYRVIRQIEGLHISPNETPSTALITNARATAAITGTAVIESACLGRPGLIFGHPWFEGCPNVHRVGQGTDLGAILAEIPQPRGAVRDWLVTRASEVAMPGCINPSNERYFRSYYEMDGFAEAECIAATNAIAQALG